MLQAPRLFTFPWGPFLMMLYGCIYSLWIVFVFSARPRTSPHSATDKSPWLLFTNPINARSKLPSDDIRRMWQVNIFCHLRGLRGNRQISQNCVTNAVWCRRSCCSKSVLYGLLILPHEAQEQGKSTKRHAIADAIKSSSHARDNSKWTIYLSGQRLKYKSAKYEWILCRRERATVRSQESIWAQ